MMSCVFSSIANLKLASRAFTSAGMSAASLAGLCVGVGSFSCDYETQTAQMWRRALILVVWGGNSNHLASTSRKHPAHEPAHSAHLITRRDVERQLRVYIHVPLMLKKVGAIPRLLTITICKAWRGTAVARDGGGVGREGATAHLSAHTSCRSQPSMLRASERPTLSG